jgi:hypothetical protein
MGHRARPAAHRGRRYHPLTGYTVDPAAVLALCHEHAAAEAVFDVDRILRTLVPGPVYEFFPSNRSLTGWDRVETFYRVEYPRFAATVTSFELLGEWVNEQTAIQEYLIEVRQRPSDERTTPFRVLSMMPVDPQRQLLRGETLYCDEEFGRHLLGSLWEETTTITN